MSMPDGPRLARFIDTMIDLGITGQVFGEHGIGKTSTFFSHVRRRREDTALVYVPAANLTPDDLLVNAPVRQNNGELVLKQLIMRQLKPGKPFVLLIDDSLQAGTTLQSQLMQIACDWTLGEHDLRELGCIGVFLTDNESLTETAARRTDLAILDRMATLRVTAADTAWRAALSRKFRGVDLTGVFRIWASLPAELRRALSPRTLEHVIDCGLAGFPLAWGLPLVDGHRLPLAVPTPDGKPGEDQAPDILGRVAAELRRAGADVPNPPHIPDAVRRLVRTAIERRWAVLVQGPPGCGKTEVVKEVVRDELGIDPLYFSLPVTNVEDLCAPVPTLDGALDNLLSAPFLEPGDKAIVWDEYNRPKDKSTFARLMEVTQEWSLAGRRIKGLRAQIALQNPPYHLGRKLLVSRNTIAQASRFTASLEIEPDDIPANEWLISQYGPVAETVLEWWKNDIDDEGRQWMTKRTLERLIRLHGSGLPLDIAKVYLGDGEYAPVPLADLESRLALRQVTGLRELAADLDGWTARLRAAGPEGSDATDVVHRVLANAELSQLRAHAETAARLAPLLPPKLKATYLFGADPERQRFWTNLFTS
ncbi:AAA family ATPase [Actinomadura syzygii]|uniref:AAA family ATPase n=1 Tax=Actinomadura syzygii TaxID=1427538 RepID=A0A5D0ULB2_9ACTN|nr:AAA family ATPase [Actinomadura syzygii]TYC18403.1 AAA family ATPase [Actinomadura syzygii]